METERSRRAGGGPQLVEPWMVEVAWAAPTVEGTLTNRRLLQDLRVHRWSFVCYLLAALPSVEVASLGPITLSVPPSGPAAAWRDHDLAAESGPPYDRPDE